MQAYQQNTDEWREMRRQKIGASDAPVIMGVSPWMTPYQLWEEKLGLKPDKETNSWMQRGNTLEERARINFEKATGLIMVDQVVFHPTYDWMMASLDGIDFPHENIVEIKCPGAQDHEMACEGFIPPKYYPQLQHQLEVTGLDMAYYYSFDGESGALVKVFRNQEYIDKMVKKEKAFLDCVQNMEPPELSDKDYHERTDDLWLSVSSKWVQCHSALQRLKAEEEELRETLIQLVGNSNARGGGIKISRSVRKGSVDYKAIPELKQVNLDNYRKSSTESWRITES